MTEVRVAQPSLVRHEVPLTVRAAPEGRRIEGLATTWDVGRDRIRILPGACARSIAAWRAGELTIPLLDQHRYDSIARAIGVLADIEETAEGLRVAFDLVDGPEADAALARVRAGAVTGLSIGYEPVRTRTVEEVVDGQQVQVQEVLDLDLREVSLVLWPADPNARVRRGEKDGADLPADACGAGDGLRFDLAEEVTAAEPPAGGLPENDGRQDAAVAVAAARGASPAWRRWLPVLILALEEEA